MDETKLNPSNLLKGYIALFSLGWEPVYSKELYDRKCTTVYQHVYDSYYDGGRSVYETGMVM